MSEHYFTARPVGPDDQRVRRVRLRGREVEVLTAPGVFSHDGLDLGTRVLLDGVDDPAPSGTFLDLGCGWGPIALALAQASPAATVVAVDVNERALDLTAANAARLGLSNVVPLEAQAALADARTQEIDEIWSNPPIRIGKAALHDLLTTWLSRLSPAGRAYLVVQRNLGADSLQAWLAGQGLRADRLSSAKGFRILRVMR